MNIRRIAAVFAAVVALPIAACSTAATQNTTTADLSNSGRSMIIPTESGNVAVPAENTGGTSSGAGGSVGGPGEKEKQRGNTPPGMSRDGQGPAAGAIIDPTGAATGKR